MCDIAFPKRLKTGVQKRKSALPTRGTSVAQPWSELLMPTETTLRDWLTIIRGEYDESPGLHLTRPQMRRLWGFDEETCDAVLDSLVADGFLRRTSDDAFVRQDLD
jgi:hypothetical protein